MSEEQSKALAEITAERDAWRALAEHLDDCDNCHAELATGLACPVAARLRAAVGKPHPWLATFEGEG